MKCAIQINSYAGDGSPLDAKYVFGYIKTNKIKLNDNTENIAYITFEGKEEIACTIQSFELHDFCMCMKAFNRNGYGKVDITFSESPESAIWMLAEETKEVERLQSIYDNTPKWYEKEYGDIADIKILARKNIKERRKKFGVQV